MYKDLNQTDHRVHSGVPLVMLVGQPNTGKTSLFNALTHSSYLTANYPGSTVDYSVGQLRGGSGRDIQILDTPGISSLTPHSLDEAVAIDSLFVHPDFGQPDLLLVLADATQLSRQIYLALQLRQAGFPLILVVTMSDLLARKGLKADTAKLELLTGVPVVAVNSLTKQGLTNLARKIEEKVAHEPVTVTRPPDPTPDSIRELFKLAEAYEKSVLIPSGGTTLAEDLAVRRPEPDRLTLQLDRWFLHPVAGPAIFLAAMTLLFASIFWLASPLMDAVDAGFSWLAETTPSWAGTGLLADFIGSGLITGVGAVMVFVPQIVILFLLMTLLEDSGYLARGAMLIDKPMAAIGLNGRSFVPLLSGFACAIPGMMAARTIPNTRERMITILILPLMSCSARLPVYALLIAFLVSPDSPLLAGLIMALMYVGGLLSGVVVSAVVSRWMKSGEDSSFILELPAYRIPQLWLIIKTTWNKVVLYLKKAGLTILLISIAIWALTVFPNWSEPDEAERLHSSFAAKAGHVLEPVMDPIGMDWRVGVSLITAFAAREVFVSSLALTLNVTDPGDEEGLQQSILSTMKSATHHLTGEPLFTTAGAIALLLYFMIAMQCISTLAVAHKETGGWKIPLLQLSVYTIGAYILAVGTYQILKLVGI